MGALLVIIISLPFSLGCARETLLLPAASFFIRSVDDGGEDELRPAKDVTSWALRAEILTDID